MRVIQVIDGCFTFQRKGDVYYFSVLPFCTCPQVACRAAGPPKSKNTDTQQVGWPDMGCHMVECQLHRCSLCIVSTRETLHLFTFTGVMLTPSTPCTMTPPSASASNMHPPAVPQPFWLIMSHELLKWPSAVACVCLDSSGLYTLVERRDGQLAFALFGPQPPRCLSLPNFDFRLVLSGRWSSIAYRAGSPPYHHPKN
jgi:hypothetical protein